MTLEGDVAYDLQIRVGVAVVKWAIPVVMFANQDSHFDVLGLHHHHRQLALPNEMTSYINST